MKLVIRDYFSGFRISKIKARYGKDFFVATYWGTYLLLVAVTWMGKTDIETVLNYYILAFLTLFCMYSVWLHPVSLSKLLYLCPMSELERRDYLVKSYLFKIGVPLGIALVEIGILCVLHRINWAYAILMFASNAGIILCNSLMVEKRVRKNLEQKRGMFLSANSDGWETLGMIVSFCMVIYLLVGIQWQNKMMGISGIVTAIIILIVELPLTVRIIKRAGGVIELAMNYESAA